MSFFAETASQAELVHGDNSTISAIAIAQEFQNIPFWRFALTPRISVFSRRRLEKTARKVRSHDP
ncbi:hypothetical protein [Spirulina sp. 06S082]|uniref:hypothetical protein n=1 Tax=Spirulina sp. 06S082 TaxID=3110248 RepID=UPI002B1EB0E0|nr:hypothetical protein [Spirulina sp. 06S082]MEA5472249.1 hypothetical protein [Spirulina sp. 06S082]